MALRHVFRHRRVFVIAAHAHVRGNPLVLELREMSDLAFFGRFGGETARVLKCFASLSPDEVGRRVFDLHQRHAHAISDAFKTAVETHSADFVNHRLPQSSLLVMTVSQSGVPALGGISQHTDPVQSWVDEVEAERARAGPPKVDGHALQLAIDPTTKEIVIRDLLRLGDADSRLVQELHNIYQQDLSAGRAPENHLYLTSHKLADSLKLDEPTVRQRVSRCRTTVHESYKQKFGQDPPKHLLIENKARQGYRLNPHIRFVAIAELEQSASASHKPAQAVTTPAKTD